MLGIYLFLLHFLNEISEPGGKWWYISGICNWFKFFAGEEFYEIRILWVQFSFLLVNIQTLKSFENWSYNLLQYNIKAKISFKLHIGLFPFSCSTFNDFPWFLLLHGVYLSSESGSNSWDTASIQGTPEVDMTCTWHFCPNSACYCSSYPASKCG